MTEDRQGRMWVAGAGLVAVQGKHSVVYYTGRSNEFFRPVMEAPDGSLGWIDRWAGTSGSGRNPVSQDRARELAQ